MRLFSRRTRLCTLSCTPTAGTVADLHLVNELGAAEELRQVRPAACRRQRPIDIKEHRSTDHDGTLPTSRGSANSGAATRAHAAMRAATRTPIGHPPQAAWPAHAADTTAAPSRGYPCGEGPRMLGWRCGEPATERPPDSSDRGAPVRPSRLGRGSGRAAGAGEGHGPTSSASGGALAPLAGALQVAAVAMLVGLVGGGDVESEPPQQRIGDIVGQYGQGAQSFADHSGGLPSTGHAARPVVDGRRDLIDAHLFPKVKSALPPSPGSTALFRPPAGPAGRSSTTSRGGGGRKCGVRP